MSLLQQSWYRKGGWSLLLWPLSLLFALISFLRRKAYRTGLLTQHKISVPVVVVGNITVGGNGKTPLVIYICQLLKQQGYRPGVLSRGYGGKASDYPMTVETDSNPVFCGDEPLFIKQRVNCPVMVDPDRVRGARALVEQQKCDVILCDDGLQHYRLQRDIEIAVVDGNRRQGNGLLLPAGPLREGEWRLQDVDFVVLNGGSVRRGEHLMSLEPGRLVNVRFKGQSQSLSDLNCAVSALAGIGHPKRFFDLLRARGVKLKQEIGFADHHQFTPEDMPEGIVLMTEKDAVKCASFAQDTWWYLPVSASLSEEFVERFLSTLKRIRS